MGKWRKKIEKMFACRNFRISCYGGNFQIFPAARNFQNVRNLSNAAPELGLFFSHAMDA